MAEVDWPSEGPHMNQISLDLQPQPSYRLIPLTQGQFAKVSPEDYDWLMQWKWSASWHPVYRSFKATRQTPNGPRRQKTLYMSREIISAGPGIEADHRNHDTLDNQRGNLRPCTHAQNVLNRRQATTSPAKGIHWYAERRKWGARIGLNRKRIFLGLFSTAEEAKAAYDKKAAELHGEFACLGTLPKPLELRPL